MDYHTLDFARFETRFLRLVGQAGGDDKEQQQFEVVTASLSNAPPYLALSYAWGDTSQTASMEVQGQSLKMHRNLVDALWHCGMENGQLIWADAICINQADLYEKSYQINLMGQIYSKAKTVMVWLGKEAKFTQPAHKVLISSGHWDEMDDSKQGVSGPFSRETFSSALRNYRSPAEAVRGLLELYMRPYWERIWIVQEISKGHAVDVRCGSLRFDLDSLLRCYQHVRDLPRRNKSLLAAISKFREQETSARENRASRMSLAQALLESRFSLASEPRDKIFALLGMSHDGSDLIPLPSYTESLEAMLRRLTQVLINSQRPENVLLLAKWASLSADGRQFFKEPLAVDWTDLAYNTPPWLLGTLRQGARAPLRTGSGKYGLDGERLYTYGRRITTISDSESDRVASWPSIASDELDKPASSAAVLRDLTTGLLSHTPPGKRAFATATPELTDAFARMIRDADKGAPSATYRFERVRGVLDRLGRIRINDVPIWEWCRKYNQHRRQEMKTLRSRLRADSSSQQARSRSADAGGPSSSRDADVASKSSGIMGGWFGGLVNKKADGSLPSIVLPHEGRRDDEDDADKEAETENNDQPLDDSSIPPHAFTLCETLLSALDSHPEYPLQLALLSTPPRAIALVPQRARSHHHVYEISHASLPVVLKETDVQGEYELVGEVCLGVGAEDDGDGAWVSAREYWAGRESRGPEEDEGGSNRGRLLTILFEGASSGGMGRQEWDHWEGFGGGV